MARDCRAIVLGGVLFLAGMAVGWISGYSHGREQGRAEERAVVVGQGQAAAEAEVLRLTGLSASQWQAICEDYRRRYQQELQKAKGK